MKAEELMIGDYISVKPSRMPIKVAAVYHEKVAYYAVVNKLEWVRESLLEPIPLTPEILEKNGFIEEQRDCQYKPLQYCVLVDGLWITISGENYFEGKLEYIHELQHALRLCRIEKEIEL